MTDLNNYSITKTGQLSYLECPEVRRQRLLDLFIERLLLSRSPLLVPNGCKTATIKYENKAEENAIVNRKRARFLMKAHKGVLCGKSKGCRFRWFTLTQSDEALALGLDFALEFHRFITWLRKVHCPDLQYIIVEHKQGKPSKVTGRQRSNYHVITYGSHIIPVHEVRRYWQSHFKSTLTGLEEIVDIDKAIKYVAGYVSKAEKFVKSRHSQGWIFKGFVGESKRFKSEFGIYIPDDDLKELSVLGKQDLSYELECLRNTGYMSDVAFLSRK